ncbi:taurocyamine kinase-like [Liolophura sinensis]|uniref:taurocyamine kinase-like n=1 Tax=Liolophura sinensis TaxID=3198878 RepID=UPI003158CDF5
MADLGQLWEKLSGAESKSLLKKHCTPEVYETLKEKTTKFGGTLAECIRSGAENPESGVGVYASDPEGYTVFADLLNPVIMDYHKVDELNHPGCDYGSEADLNFGDLDPSGELIVSTRVRVGRSHDSYGFPPTLNKEQREEMEKVTREVLEGLTGELKGTYYPLDGMTEETQKQLTEDHFLFKDDDRFLKAAGGYDDWPAGRGIFFNDNKTFLVWVNEEDHIRIISMQKGGDLAAVYKRLVSGIQELEKKLQFARLPNLGYLTFCPSNLGTALRASVHVKIPKVAAMPEFKEICDKYHIQARGIHGEHTESVGGVYDISNKRRLGLTEIQAIEEMRRGVEELIRLEKGHPDTGAAKPESDLPILWEKLESAKDSKSLLKKHCTKKVYEKLKDKKTKFGGTLAECIRSGAENPESGVGVYASDPEGYTVFADLLNPVIMDYHKVNKLKHPECNFGSEADLSFGDLDPEGELIVSTRVRVGRSHDSYGFPPTLNKEQREEMEKVTREVLEGLTGELKGTYYPLDGMTEETQKQLTEDHFLFKDDDRFLKAAGGYDDWPAGRGIFFNDNKTFLVWVNEEDHIRIISMQKGGDLAAVYKRLVSGIQELEKKLQFARLPNLGYLTFCPSNLGTALRASVHVKIPKVAAMPEFKEICDKYHIQARGIHGEHTESVGGVYDISNKRRLGLTEIQAIEEMRRGVEELIRLEKGGELKDDKQSETKKHSDKPTTTRSCSIL